MSTSFILCVGFPVGQARPGLASLMEGLVPSSAPSSLMEGLVPALPHLQKGEQELWSPRGPWVGPSATLRSPFSFSEQLWVKRVWTLECKVGQPLGIQSCGSPQSYPESPQDPAGPVQLFTQENGNQGLKPWTLERAHSLQP